MVWEEVWGESADLSTSLLPVPHPGVQAHGTSGATLVGMPLLWPGAKVWAAEEETQRPGGGGFCSGGWGGLADEIRRGMGDP